MNNTNRMDNRDLDEKLGDVNERTNERTNGKELEGEHT
jgi:hypothetical protein